MNDGPFRTLSLSEKLRWIRQRAKNREGTFIDWSTVERIAKRLALDPTSDLRLEFEKARKRGLPSEVDYAFKLMTARWFGEERLDHDLFVYGADLGPLETLQVYSTDFFGFDVPKPNVLRSLGPKSHAPLHCHRSDEPSRFAELTTYGEFLPRYAEWSRWTEDHGRPPTYDLCSFCGGATIRLLTDEQVTYYRKLEQEAAARQAAQLKAGVARLRPRRR